VSVKTQKSVISSSTDLEIREGRDSGKQKPETWFEVIIGRFFHYLIVYYFCSTYLKALDFDVLSCIIGKKAISPYLQVVDGKKTLAPLVFILQIHLTDTQSKCHASAVPDSVTKR